jgi:hypothetical protein
LKNTYGKEMAGHIKTAEELKDDIRQVLALVPGEQPPLIYNGDKGSLEYNGQRLLFLPGAPRAIFERLILCRSGATISDLMDTIERNIKGTSHERETPNRKDTLRDTIADLNTRLKEGEFPLTVEKRNDLYRLNNTVHMSDPE